MPRYLYRAGYTGALWYSSPTAPMLRSYRTARPGQARGGVAPGLSAPRALKARALGESGLKPFHGTILPAARPRARTVATIPPAWPPSFTHRPAAAPHLQSRSAACLPAGVSKPAGRLAIHTSWAGLRAVTGPLDPTIRLQPRGVSAAAPRTVDRQGRLLSGALECGR